MRVVPNYPEDHTIDLRILLAPIYYDIFVVIIVDDVVDDGGGVIRLLYLNEIKLYAFCACLMTTF